MAQRRADCAPLVHPTIYLEYDAVVEQREATKVWARVAALSFGGPAGQIATMHREVVEQRGWVSEAQFLHALNFCMLLPGPEAQQLATYLGWLLGGTRGGLIAGGLFVLPGMVALMALSWLSVLAGETTIVRGLFAGLQAAVLVIVVEALIKVAKRALTSNFAYGVAGLAFLALFVFALPFPLVLTANMQFRELRRVLYLLRL